MNLNKEQILSIIRYTLTTIGATLVTKGTIDTEMVLQLSGCIMALVSGIWSIIDKTDTNMAIKVANYQAKLAEVAALEDEKVN
jgi:hypothetical protein